MIKLMNKTSKFSIFSIFFLIVLILILIVILFVVENLEKIPRPKVVCVKKVVNNTVIEECKNVSSYFDKIPKVNVKWD